MSRLQTVALLAVFSLFLPVAGAVIWAELTIAQKRAAISAPTPTVTVTAPPATVRVTIPPPPPRTVYVERADRSERRTAPATGAAQRYARPLVSAAQWPCLRELWQRESGWSPRSRSGSHFGIAQRRGETATDYRTQVDRGLRYIAHRYGTPCRALAAHDRKGWY